MVPYTYLLTHIPTGKRYYGVRYAKGCHPSDLWVTYFSSSRDVSSLPKEEFVAEVRKVFTDKHNAYDWEQKVILRMQAWRRDDWFNLSAPKFGRFMGKGRVKGFKFSDESKKKMAASAKKRGLHPNTLENLRTVNKGRKITPEENAKRSSSLKEHNKIHGHKGGPPMGHTLSDETKAKISMRAKGRKRAPTSDETRAKIAESIRASWAKRKECV